MTVTYGFYDSLNGDRKYNAEQMSRIFEGIINDGVFSSVGAGFAVSAASGMNINVGTGRAWFSFTWTLNDGTLPLTVDASEVTLNRIDTVVIEVNKDVTVRTNTIKIVKGTPAASPVAPTLANTATLKQKPLADIYVGASVTSITAGNITNRIGTTDTPWVTGPLTTIDFTTFYGRFESNFNAWFANLQNQLTTNQASNLQNQIDGLSTTRNDGWVPMTTATYNAANAINVPAGADLIYRKGWGVRFKQGGAYKYFYILSATSTVLTLTAGTSYVVDNAPITDLWFAKEPMGAFGFNNTFIWNPTVAYGGGTTNPTSMTITTARFSIHGGKLSWTITATLVRGSGNRTVITFSMPVTPALHGGAAVYDTITGGGASKNATASYVSNSNGLLNVVETMANDGIIIASGDYYI